METGAISHAEIEVSVTDASGDALPGVTGVLQNGMTGERIEVSNARGRMVFGALPPGAYELSFTLEGFAEARREVTIHATDEHDPLDVVLQVAEA